MFRSRRRAIGIALFMILPLVLAACSSTGGKKAAQAAQGSGTSVAAGHANTQRYTIAMITHAAPGDTFWDIIRHGALAAAASAAFLPPVAEHAARTSGMIMSSTMLMARLGDLNIVGTSG